MKFDLDNNFFGRQTILNTLKRRVADLKEGYRQNIALLGNQFCGKSSILRHFILNLDDEQMTSIYLDLENKDCQYLFSKLTGSLLYNYLKSRGLPLQDDLDLLIESTQNDLPHTVQVARKVRLDLSHGKIKDAFLGLMTLPEVYSNETGKCCVLVLDEFQNLEDMLGEQAFQELGKKIMTQKKSFYIVSSSQVAPARKILSEKLSLLFGNFEIITVEPFDAQTSQEFISHNLMEIKAGVQLKHFLTDFTGGHPLYLNLICKELINLTAIHKQNEIYMPVLTQAVENTIFSRWGVISRHFELIVNELCSGKGNRAVCSVLISLANGKNKVEDLMKDTDMKKSPVRQKLNRLLEQGILVKNGNFYYFSDKLFKYWIKYVYQKRLRDVELSPDRQKKEFKEEFHRSVDYVRSASGKDFSSRIQELLYCFDNESFDLNGRKYKLPVFRDVQLSRVKNEQGIYLDILRAKTRDAVWFVFVKRENFAESDMNAILKETKRFSKRAGRCLIVSLKDLEENARLRALQEKFWIWNEGELNTLLTLFDKPFIL